VSQIVPSQQHEPTPALNLLGHTEPSKSGKKKSRKKKRAKGEKLNKWANKCMYAELLEMRDDSLWLLPGGARDGLPEDLESGWVAVAPVPVGKRCLAVTHQSSGIIGVGMYAILVSLSQFAEVHW
jgi:snurportin-1